MLLSIVIPHYNLPRELLRRCVDSVLAQGIPDDDFEVLVVDDGSEQPPLWLNEAYAAGNVRLVSGSHGGPGAARNKGIEEANGRYIQFVDADDFLFENGQYLQCIDVLRSECPQILRFFYHVQPQGTNPRKFRKKSVRFGNTISGAVYMRDNNLFGSPCTYFFLRELVIENGVRFPENMFHEDEVFNTMLHYHAQTLVESNAVLYCYSLRDGSTTSNASPEFEARRLGDFFSAIEQLSAFKESNAGSSNALQNAGMERKMNMLAVDFILGLMYNGRKAKEVYAWCVERLAPLSLYPLPEARYSFKYRAFRFFANSKWGMRLLRLVIPKHKPLKK